MFTMTTRRAAVLATLCSTLALAGACTVDDPADPGGDDPESSAGAEVSTITASPETTQAVGVHSWRAAAAGARVAITGLGAAGDARARGALTMTVSADGDSVWDLELTHPAAARTRFVLGELQPQPSGDAQADRILAAFIRDLLAAEPPPPPPGAGGASTAELLGGDDLSVAPRMPADTAANRLKARGALRCLQAFADQAYLALSGSGLASTVCGLSLERARSTDVQKLYTGATATTITAVVAFAGTRLNFGDWIIDLKSQTNVTHNNPFVAGDSIGPVGAGWDTRVRSQATLPVNGKTLVARVDELIQTARQSNKELRVFVTGHSLGAVSAELAGYDLARRLQTSGVRQQVWVTMFNPPRLGQAAAQATYQSALLAPCAQPTANKLCLGLWSLTRSLDPVQSLPLAMSQVVWQPTPGARTLGTGANSGAALAYCPQYNAPQRSIILPVLNHALNAWVGDINSNLSDAHLSCMFKP